MSKRPVRERRRGDQDDDARPVKQQDQDDQKPVAEKPADVTSAAPVAPVADPAKPAVDAVKQQPVVTDAPAPDAPAADKVTVPTALLVALGATKQQSQAEKPAVAGPATAATAAPAQQQQQAAGAAQGAQVAADAAQAQADATAKPAAADAAKAVVPTDDAVPAAPQADAKPVAERPAQQAPAAQPHAKSSNGQTGDASQQSGQQQGQSPLSQPAADQARPAAQAYGRNTSTEVPTPAQSGTPAASPATPVASGQPAAARGELAPATPVPLARAAENVEHVLRLAANRGVTHARIALTPESLGSIDVHLRHTAEGVVAKVVAHSPDAVQQLQQAAADLRRQLDSQGVNVLSLDIGQSSADDRSAGSAGASFGDGGRGENRGASTNGDATATEAETTVNSTLQLPNGVLVDVLA